MEYYIEIDSETSYATGVLISANEPIHIGSYVQIDEPTYHKLRNEEDRIKAYKLNDGNELVLDETKHESLRKETDLAEKVHESSARITELKQLLAGLDYLDIKYLEGCLSEEEFREKIMCKQTYRDEINSLEHQIECLTTEGM